MADCERRVRIQNDLGVHLRAAGVLVQVAGVFRSEIWIDKDGTRANAKSIMSVLALAAGKGAEVVVLASGPDAQEAVDAVCSLIDHGFEAP